MFRAKLIPATMAAVIALGTAGVAFGASGDDENGKEISAVLNAKTTVTEAIAAAEKQTGGRALKVDVRHKEGTFLYEVKTVSQDKVSEVHIDPASGAITRTEDEGLIAKLLGSEDQDEFAKLTAAPVTLATAVATAEKETGGKAIEAAFDSEDGQMLFNVEVAKNEAVQKVKIDAASGKILKVSAAENGEHDED